MKKQTSFILFVGGLALAFPLSACQSVLGIEDLELAQDASTGDGPTDTGGTSDTTGGEDNSETTGGAEATGGTPQAGEQEGLCQDYCTSIIDVCGVDKIGAPAYRSMGECLDYCAFIPLGATGDTTGNTLHCRLNQVLEATVEGLVASCKNAGPSGGAVCGAPCENYCQFEEAICTSGDAYKVLSNGLLAGLNTEERIALCETQCPALWNRQLDAGGNPESPSSEARTYHALQHANEDSLQCRLIQLGEAASDAEWCFATTIYPHLQHAVNADNENPCRADSSNVPSCPDYCRVVATACPGELAVYESAVHCADACSVMELGTVVGGAKNTVACRLQHAYNALVLNPASHCPHAGPGGNGVCSDNDCQGYCVQLEAGCSDLFSGNFGDSADAQANCAAACEAAFDSPNAASYRVETAQEQGGLHCRLDQAVRAVVASKGGVSSETERVAHCESAFGGGVCTP